MEKRIIPFRNYIILFLICISVILLSMYFNNWYRVSQDAKIEKGIMSGFLPEVRLEELDNYLQENPNQLIYISSSTDETIKRFEKSIYDYIVKNNTSNLFVYIDTSEIDTNELISKLKSKSNIKNANEDTYLVVPNIYVVKEGKIEEVLYTTKTSLNTKEATNFITKQEKIG